MKLAPQEIRTFFITSVTWERRSIFNSQPLARLLLDTIYRYRTKGKYLLHELVIMPNHLHLLLTPAAEVSLEGAVQFIKGGFSYRVKTEMHSGLVIWEPSFTNHRVRDTEDYDNHAAYIHQNPVGARLAEAAELFPFSSAHPAWELDPRPPGLKPRGWAAKFSQA